MANNIALAKVYTTALDQVYKEAALSADLDNNNGEAKQGANANELIIPKLSMDGLANYSRNGGYVGGDVSLTYETVKCNYDRGRMFTVDTLDNIETAGVAFGRLAGEFERTKVVPELDAFRFSAYAQVSGISTTDGAALSTGAAVVAALREASNKLDEDEVPQTERILYITPTLKGLVDDLDTTKSKAVLTKFAKVVEVPQSRFVTKVTLNDGTTEGQTNGGFVKAADAKDINFLVVHKSAPIQYIKHSVPKIIDPQANQSGDAWKFGYRCVSIADIYENKVAGVYLHKSTT